VFGLSPLFLKVGPPLLEASSRILIPRLSALLRLVRLRFAPLLLCRLLLLLVRRKPAVELPSQGAVDQVVVGLLEPDKLFARLGISRALVRVDLEGEFPVRRLERLVVGVLGDSQNHVVVDEFFGVVHR